MKSLRAWRAERLLSTHRLATLANASNKTIVQIENGRQTPSFVTIDKISRALGVSPREVAEFDRALDQRAGLATTHSTALQSSLERKRVFCVCESSAFLVLVRKLLETNHFAMTTVTGAPVTFEQIAAFHPDLLIVELEAGRTVGWDLLERLAHDAGNLNVPLIATTRDKQLLARAEGLTAQDGGHPVIAAPLDQDLHQVVAAINSVFAIESL